MAYALYLVMCISSLDSHRDRPGLDDLGHGEKSLFFSSESWKVVIFLSTG